MTRTQIINDLIRKHRYKTYLEIGVQHEENNFMHIKASKRIGVDPDHKSKTTFIMTSDQFFRKFSTNIDIVFIDGLHHATQVLRDFNNSVRILNKGGSIVLHDVNPKNYEAQLVPRRTREWNGDVWRTWLGILDIYPDAYCINECGIVENITEKRYLTKISDMKYENLAANKNELIKLIDYGSKDIGIAESKRDRDSRGRT